MPCGSTPTRRCRVRPLRPPAAASLKRFRTDQARPACGRPRRVNNGAVGNPTSRSVPAASSRLLPAPCFPEGQRHWDENGSPAGCAPAIDDEHDAAAATTAAAVSPPSGLNFSRCTEAQPLPLPARAWMTTRSTNRGIGHLFLSNVKLSALYRELAAVSHSAGGVLEVSGLRRGTGTMFTSLRPRLVPNSTAPERWRTVASSSPRPTLTPG